MTRGKKRQLLRKVFLGLLCGACLTLSAMAQTPHSEEQGMVFDQQQIQNSLDALKQGNLAETNMDMLARVKAVEAIPDLKKQFAIAPSEIEKEKIANALRRLGDKDPGWWDYLSEKANDAVNSDMPSLVQFDSDGKPKEGPSPEFLAWAKLHSLTLENAQHKLSLDFAAMASLMDLRDRREIPILRQGLLSPNYMIQTASALGLAKLQDKDSIPLIISACERAPAGLAFAIARGLVDFNTPEAQSAAKRFRPPQPPR